MADEHNSNKIVTEKALAAYTTALNDVIKNSVLTKFNSYYNKTEIDNKFKWDSLSNILTLEKGGATFLTRDGGDSRYLAKSTYKQLYVHKIWNMVSATNDIGFTLISTTNTKYTNTDGTVNIAAINKALRLGEIISMQYWSCIDGNYFPLVLIYWSSLSVTYFDLQGTKQTHNISTWVYDDVTKL